MINRFRIFWWMSVINIKVWLLTRRVTTHVKKRNRMIERSNAEFNRNRLIWAYDDCLGEDGKGIRDLTPAMFTILRLLK